MKTENVRNVIAGADIEDIATLINLITDNGKGRVSLDSDVCRDLHHVASMSPLTLALKNTNTIETIAREIESFGGNSIVNFFRGKGVDYHEIVCDVASHVGANFNDKQDTGDIEVQILLKILEKSMEKMTPAEREELLKEVGKGSRAGVAPAGIAGLQALVMAGGFASYRIALIVANAVARQLTGRGLALAANAGIARAVGAFAGPIGWAITVIWTAFDLASPAYRVTVPAVAMIAYMRQKARAGGGETNCTNCGAQISGAAKFCPECGTSVTK